MKKIIPGLLSMLLCLGMATGCDAVKEKLPDVKLPGFLENILGKESASSEEDTASESTPDSSTPDDSSEEPPALHAHEQDLKDVKEYLQGIVNEMSLETRKEFKLINSYAFFGETAKYDIAWSVNVEGITIVEGETEDTVKIGEFAEDTPFVLTATITDPEGCHTTTATFDGIALKALSLVPTMISAKPVENTAYKLYVYQQTLAKDLYFNGYDKAATYYFGTTENYEEAVDVYAEYIEGSDNFYLTFTYEGVKKYIGVRLSEDKAHDNIVATTEPVSSFFWNEELQTVCTHLDENKNGEAADYYMGNYSNKDTISMSMTSYASTSNVGGLVTMVDKNQFTPAVKVATELERLSVKTTFVGADSYDLPTSGVVYSDVAISWEVVSGESVAIADGKLTTTAPAADTSAVIKATLTCGDVTETKEFTIAVKAETEGPAAILNQLYALADNEQVTGEFTLTGKITALDNYSNPTIVVDGYENMPVYCYRLSVTNAIGEYITVTATTMKNYGGTYEFMNCTLVTEGGNEGETTELPADGSTLTIDEVLALTYTGDTANKYYVTGTVKEVYNTTYGNMYITDEDGTELTVYGTYNADGTLRFDAMDAAAQPKAGDIVKFYSILSSYNGKNQLKNAWIMEVTPGQGGSEGGNEGEGETPSTPSEVVKATGDSFTIESYATANAWANSTLYATIEHEFYTITASGTPVGDWGLNSGKYYTSGQSWRIYQNESPAVTFTAVEGKTIATIKVTYAIKNGGILTFNGTNYESDALITVNAATATFGVGQTGTATNGQVQITAIEVLFAEEAPATYTLTLMNGNPRMGGTMETFEYEEGAKLDLAPLTADGKTFLGWFATDDAGEYVAAPETMPAEAVALFAVWEVTAYTVTFVNGEETTSVKFGVEYDFANGIEATVNELSYVLADNLPEGYMFQEMVPETFELKDYTFTIVEIPPTLYTLTLVNGENPRVPGAVTTSELVEGATLELPVLEAEGKTFKGWYLVDLATGMPSEEAPKIMPAAALTLKAVWEYEIYTLTIVNGETSTEFQFAVEYNGNIMISVNDLAYVLADNLPEGYIWLEEVPETFELKNYTFTAHKHAYDEKVVSPTCTTDGYTTYACGCGDTYNVAGETALGHADEDNDFKCDNCSTIVEPKVDTLTLDEAIALGKLYAHNTYTTNKYYVTATIADIYNTTFGNANVYAEDGTKFVIYGMYNYDGSVRYDALETKPGAGDEVTVYGIIGNYSGTPQMKNGWIDDFIAHEHDYSEVVTAPTCTTDGYTTVTCSICKASSVKDVVTALGHTTEAGTCERCGNEIGGESSEPAVVATFDFGANGTASHVDGNDLGASKSYTVGTYTLALTNMSKVYGPAYDAKGNSCLKFGTSKVIGSMSFTVPENVTKVVIYAAKYKSNSTKVNVNGTDYSLTKNSNDGAYDAIEVDTTTTKTVTFKTVASTYRAMINTIEFWA